MNKPVAWMYEVDGITCWTKVPHDDKCIPLYTHPVKEQEEPNWKEMYWWMHDLNYKHWSELSKLKAHPVKELTDEEITKLFHFYAEDTYSHGRQLTYWMEFAKAILRKAQENE